MISHIDITPSLLDFAGGLDRKKNAPKNPLNAKAFWTETRRSTQREPKREQAVQRLPRTILDARSGESR